MTFIAPIQDRVKLQNASFEDLINMENPDTSKGLVPPSAQAGVSNQGLTPNKALPLIPAPIKVYRPPHLLRSKIPHPTLGSLGKGNSND